MNNSYQSSQGDGRNRNQNGRSSSRGNGSRYRRNYGNSRRRRDFRPSSVKKKSIWQKILSWFKPKRKRVVSQRPQGGREKQPIANNQRRREFPPLDPQSIMTKRLYVGNLSYDVLESDLFDLFSEVGLVKNVEIIMDRRFNRSKGFGFVEMAQVETARSAAVKLHRKDFKGRSLLVSEAKSDPKMEQEEASPQRIDY